MCMPIIGSSFSIFVLTSAALAVFYYALFSVHLHLRYPAWTIPTSDPPAPTNLSHIVFGIGSSVSTWNKRHAYSQLWWRPSQMRGHVWLDKAPADGDWTSTSPPWRINSNQTAGAARIACVVTEAYAMGMEGVRWFVMGDDDTIFFPENLVAVLRKYDHDQMYYIGAPSESVEQNERHSYGLAFGGGGFAVSYAAAAALSGVMDGCLQRYAHLYGSDERVHGCFSEVGVPLTREPGFHQVDLRHDIYGMLAAHPVAPLLSLHHMDYVQPISPLFPSQMDALRTLFRAASADQARILQQSVCYLLDSSSKWSLSISWGYTVLIYPWIAAPIMLEMPFRTFEKWDSGRYESFNFNTRELEPPSLPCKRPRRFFFQWVAEGPNGTVSEYKSMGWGDEAEECTEPAFRAAAAVKTVRVFAPRLDPSIWSKAPRRQCCDASRRIEGDTVEMRIRECGRGEATSPP